MLNIVTGADGQGQAVLIRAIAPYAGLPTDPSVGRGPGKVTTALGIDRRLDRRSLATGALFVAAGESDDPLPVECGPRIGVAYAAEWAERPFRFWLRDHPAVSRATVSTRRKR
jgi:DNA-3-methyladenine glycosylase